MEEKLEKLYNECINELASIGINVLNEDFGNIDIKIAKRNSSRYGCCKQEEPDKNFYHFEKRKYRNVKVYDKFKIHHIEICRWVMELNDNIIKNTIIHEIIHCFPYCNNHGKIFKSYAKIINEKLNYNITRLGNKKEDFEKSNVEYKENLPIYNYKIICKNCGQVFYRKRLQKNFLRKYRCGKCSGKFDIFRGVYDGKKVSSKT